MTGMLQYNFNASLIHCPSQSIKKQMEMNTYDDINLQLSVGSEKMISILPNSTTEIKFFCITSDLYSELESPYSANSKMIYKNNVDTQSTGIPIILDKSHVLIGKSMLDKIGNLSKLKLTNSSESANAPFRNLVGRDG